MSAKRGLHIALSILIMVSLMIGTTSAYGINSELQTSTADELVTEYIKHKQAEQQMIERGRLVFEQLLESQGANVPEYGTKEYERLLFEYADPKNDLRKKSPEKWRQLEAYAYDYYVCNLMPLVSPNDIYYHGKQSVETQVEQSRELVDVGTEAAYFRSGAVEYAYRYVGNSSDSPYYKNYNPAYKPFTADCTNFVSQCLFEGGNIPMVDAPWRPYTDSDDWYYYRNGTDSFDINDDDDWSWSWVKVNSLHWQIRNRLGTLVSSPSQLQLGDVVQVDLDCDGTPDDHSMIVTKIDSSGNRYVSYHTNNTKDKPLSDLYDYGMWLLHITY